MSPCDLLETHSSHCHNATWQTCLMAPLRLLCASLRPANGGQDCPGVNYEYQLCNTDDCPKHFEDFRAQQCQLRNSHFEFQSAKHHWLPYEHPDGQLALRQSLVVRCKLMAALYLDFCSHSKVLFSVFQCFVPCVSLTSGLLPPPFAGNKRCHLYCQSRETGDVAYMKLLVHDGTRCSYKDAYSICVRGECVVRMPDTAECKLLRC